MLTLRIEANNKIILQQQKRNAQTMILDILKGKNDKHTKDVSR